MEKLTTLNIRVTKEQKELWRKAASLAGFKNLKEFILSSVDYKARVILNLEDNCEVSYEDFLRGVISNKFRYKISSVEHVKIMKLDVPDID